MLIKHISVVLMALLASGAAFAADESDVKIQVDKPGATVTVERVINDGKMLISVVDAGNQPLLGLSGADFSVMQSGRPAKVASAQPLSESMDVPRHLVLVLDNSFSMGQRGAVKALLAGVDGLLDTVRPIDDVRLVVFDDKSTVRMDGRELHVQTFKSNRPAELKDFTAKAYRSNALTSKTVLYDGMVAGLELMKDMPATEPQFMVVFSDGEDLNSIFTRADVIKTAEGSNRFNAYAIDYMPRQSTNAFLAAFTGQNRGQTWKAASETTLVPIFQNVASRMQQSYVVSYQFPSTGTLAVAPASLTIDQIKTIDASPMLGQVFFDKGSSEFPPRYVHFTGPGDTAGFNEQMFSVTLQKYYEVLNIIGKRLTDTSDATITLVGCNDNTGQEKGNTKLSTQRAEAVRDYLKTVWNIAPDRMTIQARNLPAKPSAGKTKEGSAENRRVEIISTDQAILVPIRSTYLSTRIDTSTLTLRPDVDAPNGIVSWRITAANASGNLADLAGEGAPAKEILIPLSFTDLGALAAGGDILVKMELQDNTGQHLVLSPDPVKINFTQTSQGPAQKQGHRVQEKYALILFDFNKEAIGPLNQEIINRIVAHMKTLPQATIEIVGHTDNIGDEKYNLKLSERRALAVYTPLTAAYGDAAGDRIRYSGVGQNSPLFDNLSPEALAFNRTVTVTLDYLSTE